MRRFNQLQEIDLPDRLEGDEIRLKQILINLAKNAIKFTKLGYVRIMAGFDELTGHIRVQVCDSGSGIAKNEIPQLFNKFGKLFRTADINNDGIGLGLMISKALVEQNGGSIDIFSDGIERESIFTFSMEMSKVD